jgi:hypothetical protein
MNKLQFALYIIAALSLAYFLIRFTFDLLLRGFAPVISSRPWVIQTLIEELKKDKIKENPVFYSLSCGKSGFLYFVGKAFPHATLIGVEHDFFPFLLEKAQVLLRLQDIKVIYTKRLYNLDVSRASVIYCYLGIEYLRELPKKFKFECKPGTLIISVGFPIPNLPEKKVLEISQQQGRLQFLSKRKLLSSKKKEAKRPHLIYIYEI